MGLLILPRVAEVFQLLSVYRVRCEPATTLQVCLKMQNPQYGQSGQYAEAGQVPQQVRPQPGPHTEMANPLKTAQQAPHTVEGQVHSMITASMGRHRP